jgi:hypothetical protein
MYNPVVLSTLSTHRSLQVGANSLIVYAAKLESASLLIQYAFHSLSVRVRMEDEVPEEQGEEENKQRQRG